MNITPDEIVYWEWRWVALNATLVHTWIVMALLAGLSWLATRKLRAERPPSRWVSLTEVIVDGIRNQVREVSQGEPSRYLPFVGTLFVFIATANVLTVVPGFHPPTGSLSTTAALAACVFVATPGYGIARRGLRGYLRHYCQPSLVVLPFNIIGELSRTLALAVRLCGNIMSGTLTVAILVSLAPLFFPVLMRLFGMLIGLVQAYIFAVLAMVYIASAERAWQEAETNNHSNAEGA